MKVNNEIFLKAQHSPYWTRIYETCDGIFSEDIFSVKQKQEPCSHPSWEDAVITAMDHLRYWENKIDGFEHCIDIANERWPDYSISFRNLCQQHNEESDYLLNMLNGKKYFDTGWAVMCENGFTLRILCVCDRIQIQVSKRITDLKEFVKNTLLTEEEIWLPNSTIETACHELQERIDFSLDITAEAMLIKGVPLSFITDKIGLMILEVAGKLEDQQRIARAAVLDLEHGKPMQYAVIVDIPNTSQRGYYISARSTAELMEKLLHRTNIGSSATITYSMVLSDNDILLE